MKRSGFVLPLLLLAACAPSREVWFTPNVGSLDMLDLFSRHEDWRRSRREIDVFKFYAGQLLGDPGFCATCGPNRVAALERVAAFRRLYEWGIAVAIEAAALKEWDCRGELTTRLALEAIGRVRANGAPVRYLAMDEPLLAAGACSLPADEAAARTAAIVLAIRREHPQMLVGDIEPYPFLSAARITSFLQALARAGAAPDFFHLDVDRVYAAQLRIDVAPDLRAIRDACQEAGVRFGVILWGADSSSEEEYWNDVLAWAQQVGDAFDVAPDHYVFQSWAASPDGTQKIPRNLPESGDVHSHTRLILEGLRVLRRPMPPRPDGRLQP
jgi:hypothetical protein